MTNHDPTLSPGEGGERKAEAQVQPSGKDGKADCVNWCGNSNSPNAILCCAFAFCVLIANNAKAQSSRLKYTMLLPQQGNSEIANICTLVNGNANRENIPNGLSVDGLLDGIVVLGFTNKLALNILSRESPHYDTILEYMVSESLDSWRACAADVKQGLEVSDYNVCHHAMEYAARLGKVGYYKFDTLNSTGTHYVLTIKANNDNITAFFADFNKNHHGNFFEYRYTEFLQEISCVSKPDQSSVLCLAADYTDINHTSLHRATIRYFSNGNTEYMCTLEKEF